MIKEGEVLGRGMEVIAFRTNTTKAKVLRAAIQIRSAGEMTGGGALPTQGRYAPMAEATTLESERSSEYNG